MDIEKERKAFEAIPKNARLLRGAIFKDGEYVALSLFDESSKELAAQLNYGWSMWQAAKAVPEGFVLVPKEPTEEMLIKGNRLALADKGYRYDATSIWETMLEAVRGGNE
ncbi:hypothetical protein F974_01887 [Acinetobacter sp. CIP 102159]|uniref:hypothetical protein n=1 Tax=Acinetobacter sp. CIP 102159 TaxID=1144667 RepID=UPI0002CE60D3|nr:hypothetical protein [Acinetobacter sp. CIP 102159]ENU83055.1 hypothetical protein F974_01887 [Acinetobacter sp. CIP 102159]